MTDYDETLPLRQLQEMKQRIAAMQDYFTDVDGNPIDLGYPVQYILNPSDRGEEDDEWISVWNRERWGIVVGLTKTPKYDYEKSEESETEFDVSVRIERPIVVTTRGSSEQWSTDEFSCDVKSVRVIQ